MFPSLQTFFLYLFPFLVFIIYIRSKWFLSDSKSNKNLPPSPWKLPIVGNLHQLGSNPHRTLQALSQKHGPLMLLHFGSVPVLVASSAEVAKEIVKTHDLVFSSRPKLSIAHRIFYSSKDIAFAPYGEYWRQLKSIVVLQLLSNKRVLSFRRVREEETTLMIDRIGESCGSVFDLSEVLVSLTNNVICRVALGRTFRGLKFKDVLQRLMTLIGVFNIGAYIPWLSWVDRWNGLDRKVDEVAKAMDKIFEGVLEEHINKKRAVGGGDESEENQDLVDILLEVQRENATGFTLHRDTIKAVILDMFVAGTDTTFTNIEWAVTELIRHPRVMKKLQQEVSEVAQGRPMITEEDLEKMHYLKEVIKESLRLHITLPLLAPRETRQDVKVMGYDIAAGTQVIVNAWEIGRDPSLWEQPEEFRPERFLNSCIDYKGFHFELIPFGAGRRGCPGIQFAVAINELAIANVVYKFDLALPNGAKGEDLDVNEIYGMSVHKKSPLVLVATPRSK